MAVDAMKAKWRVIQDRIANAYIFEIAIRASAAGSIGIYPGSKVLPNIGLKTMIGRERALSGEVIV